MASATEELDVQSPGGASIAGDNKKREASPEPDVGDAAAQEAARKKKKTGPGSRGVANLTPEQLAKKRENGTYSLLTYICCHIFSKHGQSQVLFFPCQPTPYPRFCHSFSETPTRQLFANIFSLGCANAVSQIVRPSEPSASGPRNRLRRSRGASRS